jgi:hypothetical protein
MMCAMKKAGVLSILFVMILLAVAVRTEAQQPTKVPRIGYLTGGPISANRERHEAFQQSLRDLGYIEGKTL